MAYELVIERIEERRKAKGWSERKMLVSADVGEKSLYHLKQGRAPKPGTLAKLAVALGVPAAYLLEAAGADTKQPDLQPAATMDTVFVRGAVQAGVWSEGVEWDAADWYAVNVPTSRKYPGVQRFGLEVRGTSMDRFYPDGTVVLTVKFGDLGRNPADGDHVVVLRRDPQTDFSEATLKEYRIDEAGRHILWPRSSDPDFQVPIVLASGNVPVSDGTETLPLVVNAGDARHYAGEADVVISALVTGIYREV